ncbi:helix-turn-helix transcriptional regulator [Modestobacter versicolor]|uniref:helix-turn-helix transcriptional regulator n=1 Tax=Modestobacter versicolor TaxID=429133 RepID=UPI0034DFDED0
MDGARPVLTAQLRVPPVPRTLVPRTRLTARLDALSQVPVAVVTGGAGWGKTTLLAGWVRSARLPVAWVTVGAADDDPARFWTLVVTALSGPAPESTAPALAALGVPSVDPLDVALPVLLNGLAERTAPVLLVLDDLHEVADGRVAAGLELLLEHQPPALRVVLAGRGVPVPGLARLRARGRLVEVGHEDLRFTEAEARALLAGAVREDDEDAVTGVVSRSEGWAAGLALGALALRDAAAGHAVRPGPPGREHALEYLAAEVLAGQPAGRRELLTAVAVLDRASGPLLDAVLDRRGSAAELAALERTGTFVGTADGEWYRMHELTRAALRREADPARTAELLTRAARWSVAAGLPEDAVRALLAAGDHPAAADVLVASTGVFLGTGRVGEFAQLGALLEPTATRSVPLLASLAWAAGVTGRLDRVPALLDRAERLLREGAPDPGHPGFATTVGVLASLRSVYGTPPTADRGAARTAAEAAVAAETDPGLPGWVAAHVALGGALLGGGDPAAALPVLDRAWAAPATAVLPVPNRLEVAGLLGWCLLEAGDPARARELVRTTAAEVAGLEAALGDAAAGAVALLHAVAARLAGLDGDLPSARRRSARAADLVAVQAHPAVAVLVLVDAADTALRCGEPRAALALLDQAREAARDAPPAPELAARVAALGSEAGSRVARSSRAVLAEPLTEREVTVLRLLRGPLSRRQVAAELHLSVNTVKGYTAALYRKLGVDSRADAVARAAELGLG